MRDPTTCRWVTATFRAEVLHAAATQMDIGVSRVKIMDEKTYPVSLFSTKATTFTQHYDLVRHCILAKNDEDMKNRRSMVT